MYFRQALGGSGCGCGCKGTGMGGASPLCSGMGDAGDGLAGFIPSSTWGKVAMAAVIYIVWRKMR